MTKFIIADVVIWSHLMLYMMDSKLKSLARVKHSSLFTLSVIGKEKCLKILTLGCVTLRNCELCGGCEVVSKVQVKLHLHVRF